MRQLRFVTNHSGETLAVNPDHIMLVDRSSVEGCLRMYFAPNNFWTIKGTLVDFVAYINGEPPPHYIPEVVTVT